MSTTVTRVLDVSDQPSTRYVVVSPWAPDVGRSIIGIDEWNVDNGMFTGYVNPAAGDQPANQREPVCSFAIGVGWEVYRRDRLSFTAAPGVTAPLFATAPPATAPAAVGSAVTATAAPAAAPLPDSPPADRNKRQPTFGYL